MQDNKYIGVQGLKELIADNKYVGVQGLEELIALTKNSLSKKANNTDMLGLENDIRTNASSISGINEKIPAQANSENKLADKDFVNSSISTNTAYFRGTFESITALESYSGKKTNNDYAFVVGVDAAGNTKYSRYKWDGLSWVFEYDLNNSSFTAEQWAAIQSGITEEIVQRILSGALTPVGTVQAYAGATAPQGYLLCQGQAISKSEYAELYLVIGDLYSKPEDAEDIFRVPDLRGKFAQGANGNLGEVIEAGLPNITGSVGIIRTELGAFFWDGNWGIEKVGSGGSNVRIANGNPRNDFDASKGETKTDGTLKTADEHHVYGASDTVQPPAVAINYIIKY